MRATEDETEGNSGHEAIINDSWLRAREYIRRAEGTEMDPERALWPVKNPPQFYQHALAAHAATFQLRDDIYAYREESAKEDISELWKEQITSVEVDESEIPISLANMDQWAHTHHHKTTTSVSLVTGKETTTTTYRVLLPLAACRPCYRHMQDILRELGFTAETKDWTDEGEAKPEHLIGLLTERGQKEAKGQLPARFTKGRTETNSDS